MSMIEQPVLSQPTDSVSVNAPVMLEIDHKTVHLEFHPESKKWNSVVRMTLYHEFSDMGDESSFQMTIYGQKLVQPKNWTDWMFR